MLTWLQTRIGCVITVLGEPGCWEGGGCLVFSGSFEFGETQPGGSNAAQWCLLETGERKQVVKKRSAANRTPHARAEAPRHLRGRRPGSGRRGRGLVLRPALLCLRPADQGPRRRLSGRCVCGTTCSGPASGKSLVTATYFFTSLFF